MSDLVPDAPAGDAPHVGRSRPRLTAVETRARRRRATTWVLSLLLCGLLVNAVVGENGYLSTVQASHEEATLRATLVRARLENQRLQELGRRLATDPSAVEETARRDLGMIRPGETMIVLRDATPSTPNSTAK